MAEKSNILKSSSGIAFATILSRILGMVRTILMAQIIGGGVLMTAWGIIITVANLFRRLLGEGALGTALLPIISYIIENDGREAARKKITTIFAVLGIILAALCIVIALGSIIASRFVTTERAHLTLTVLPVAIPYAFFICLIGALGAVLNSVRIFFLPALGNLIFNIALIACLLLVCPYLMDSPKAVLYSLSIAVIISGIIQLVLMLWMLKKENLFPILKMPKLKGSPVLSELWKLTLPGLVGASALQLSVLSDRIIGCWISEYAVPSLLYSDRLVYLPISVFALSIGAVALSNMSRSAAKENYEELVSTFSFALRQVLFVCVPIAVFVVVFKTPLLRVLYQRGKFGEIELSETAWALGFYAIGIPSFAALKIVVSAFHARKDMKTPVKISIGCVILNLVLNLCLMWHLKQGGLALATVISSFTNNLLLIYLLKKHVKEIRLSPVLVTLLYSLVLSGVVVFICRYLYPMFPAIRVHRLLTSDFIPLLLAGTLFTVTYPLLALLFGVKEIIEIVDLFFMKKTESTNKI